VTPLKPPARRALPLLAFAAVALGFLVAARGLRFDAGELGFLALWGVVLAEVVAGGALVALALAEAVPGRGAGRGAALLAVAASAGLFVSLAALARRASAGMAVADPLREHGPACFAFQGLIGLAGLALAARLVLRAAPLRAAFAGLLAGSGAALIAEGVWHAGCPITDLRHVLAWHGGALLALALAGLAFGLAVERRERARMESRRNRSTA
jgi:hypothetical protein